MTSTNNIDLDHDARSIIAVREFAAPRELVFTSQRALPEYNTRRSRVPGAICQ
jgi:hypothetical protein